MSELKKIFGIDLGTTYSGISYVDEYGKAEIVPNKNKKGPKIPSVVFFESTGEVTVGEAAKKNAIFSPDRVVECVKRSMGNPNFRFCCDEKDYRPEVISSFILRKLAQDAKEKLGEEITDVVITCPAYFGINEREATRIAGETAGFKVRMILNEPTAAAYYYGLMEGNEGKVVLVYDLGGGTFDITMIEIADGIKVICTGGDHHLGGVDWDNRIVESLKGEFQKQTGSTEDILLNAETRQDLILSAEEAKITLTDRPKVLVWVNHDGHKVKVELTREKFEELTADLLERTIILTNEMLLEAQKKGHASFDKIILVGGSTWMHQIKKRVEKEFSTKEIMQRDPDEAVARGAALFGYKLAIDDRIAKIIADKMEKSIEDIQNTPSQDIPEEIVVDAEKKLAEEEGLTLPQITGFRKSMQNVTSKSFGIVAKSSKSELVLVNLITKNTEVPAEKEKSFGTEVADQSAVEVVIMENIVSEEIVPLDKAKEIGRSILHLPSGLPVYSPIDVTFRLNEEGRLEIYAVEVTQKRKVEVTIETASVIRGEELERAKESKSIVIT